MQYFSSRWLSCTLFLTTLAGRMVASADSLTATYGAQDNGSALAHPDGSFLNVGALVRLGYFDNSVDFATMNTSLTTLDGHFTELAHVQVGFFEGTTTYDLSGNLASRSDGTNANLPGYFGGSVSLDPVVMGISTKQVFLWAYDTGSIATATAHALFSDDAWKLNTFGTVVFDISTVNPLDINDYYYAVRGTETSGSLPPDADPIVVNKLIAVPVPEPATGGMALVVLLAFVPRRRASL